MSKLCTSLTNYITHLYKKLFTKKSRILLIGLPNTGKTCLIQALFEKYKENTPTSHVTIKKYESDNIIYFMYDVPYSNFQRYDHYYKKCDMLIYCVDGTFSNEKLKLARDELQNLMFRNTWVERSLLVLVTKNDLPGSASCKDIILSLDLTSMQNKDVSCFSVSSMNGTNVELVKEWMEEQTMLKKGE